MRVARSRALAALLALGLPVPLAQGQEAAASSAPAPEHKDILGTETKVYSQSDEELIIRDFFQDRRKGFFLDVGCAWPMKYNNTYYLESRLNWRGIGIDGLPDFAAAWQQKRKRSKFFNYIVTDHSGTTESFYRAEKLGISSTKPLPDPRGKTIKYDEIKVPTITLNELLQREGVTKIDFISMDIEGGELGALAGFNIDRFKPELLCVEAHIGNREKILAWFAAHRYERIERYMARDEVNYYFTPKAGARP
jgi:FkbM family methyltransferase